MRAFDRDLIRGGHSGQRSCEPRSQAEHMAAPTSNATCDSSCQPGAVHTWHFSDLTRCPLNVRCRRVVSRGRGNTLSQTQGMEWTAMDRSYARGFNAVAKEELWERWQRGQSLKAIGRAFGKPSSSIYFQVAPHGGIRPARRRRSRLALTLSER